ncbi:MAG: hypothetical protein AAGH92_00765 [Planctomycetota bacterium]
MSATRLAPVIRTSIALVVACAIVATAPNATASEALAEARRHVTIAIDTPALEPRTAALYAAARAYRRALRDPGLPPADARHARQALAAIDQVLRSPTPLEIPSVESAPHHQEPDAQPPDIAKTYPKPVRLEVADSLPAETVEAAPTTTLENPPEKPGEIPASGRYNTTKPLQPTTAKLLTAHPPTPQKSPAPAKTTRAEPPIPAPSERPSAMAIESAGSPPKQNVSSDDRVNETVEIPIFDNRRTFAAVAALLNEPTHASARAALTQGANPRGRFGPGLNPPSRAGDALHTLAAVAALTVTAPLDPTHAETLALTLLRDQSPTAGWRDPLTPVERVGDQLLPTAANLLTLRILDATPGLPTHLHRELRQAQQHGSIRLEQLRRKPALAPPDDTFSARCLSLLLESLGKPETPEQHAVFRRRLNELVHNHLNPSTGEPRDANKRETVSRVSPAPR